MIAAGQVLHLLGGVGSAVQVELGVFFVIGLLGGAHCLGMCGPLVTVYADRMQSATATESNALTFYEIRQHGLFNLGRTISYAVLGGAFGLLGALVFDTSAIVGAFGTVVRPVAGIVIGVFILAVGVRYVLGEHADHGFFGGGVVSSIFQRLSERIEDWARGPRIVGLGLAHGLLPCPILYPAFLYAFARGSPVSGALALGVLGLGTFPTLFLYGTVVQSVSPTHRARLHRVLGVAFLLLGWMPLAHGLSLFGIEVPHIELPVYQPLSG